MHHTGFQLMLYFCLTSSICISHCYADDAIRKKVDRAKNDFKQAIAEFNEAVDDWFEKEENAARKKANPADRVKEILAEKKAFEENGTLPNRVPTIVRNMLTKPTEAMIKALDKASDEYTRQQNDKLAERTRKEKEGLLASIAMPNLVGKNNKEIVNSIGMRLVFISSGEFEMGSSGEGHPKSELPAHSVKLTKGFFMGKFEVTQREWLAVVGTKPWSGQPVKEDGDFPASGISWEEATTFCQRLTELERTSRRLKFEYRLPTEAQWEYACRAGLSTAYCYGNEVSKLGEFAWYDDNTKSRGESFAHRVGQLYPNAWGLHDMHGNVWEWCSDNFDDSYYAAKITIDPVGPSEGPTRVMRGGCWRNNAELLRSAHRSSGKSTDDFFTFGFRVIRVDIK